MSCGQRMFLCWRAARPQLHSISHFTWRLMTRSEAWRHWQAWTLLLLRLVVSPFHLSVTKPFSRQALLPVAGVGWWYVDDRKKRLIQVPLLHWSELRHSEVQIHVTCYMFMFLETFLWPIVYRVACVTAAMLLSVHPPRPRQYWKAIEETNKTRCCCCMCIVISSYWLMLQRSFVGEHTWNCKINENNQLAGPYAGNYLEIIHSI